MPLHSPAQIEDVFKSQGGETVTNGGQLTYGTFRRFPLEVGEDVAGYAGGIASTAPTVLIADGILTNVGLRKGIGQTVVVDDGVSAPVSWIVGHIEPADPGEVLLVLQES